MEMATETAFTPWASLGGGVLIGLSAVMIMGLFGRVAGISGITTGVLGAVLPMAGAPRDRDWRLAFLLGLVAAPLDAGVVRDTFAHAVWQLIRGAAPTSSCRNPTWSISTPAWKSPTRFSGS